MQFFMFLRFKFFGIMPKFQEFSNLLKIAKPPCKNIHNSFFLSQGGTVKKCSVFLQQSIRKEDTLLKENKIQKISIESREEKKNPSSKKQNTTINMAIRIEIQLVILCLFLMKSTVQCWSSYDHNVRHHHHRSRNTNNIVYKQLTKVNKQQFHGFIETTTTSNVSNQLITNVNKQQQIFPCDNLICLLETFELPTEN